MDDQIQERLTSVPLHPAVATALIQLTRTDIPNLTQNAHIRDVIPALLRAFDEDAAIVEPFRTAWLLMYAAITRLDQLQDGDPVRVPLPVTSSPAAQYNFIFGFYLLATSLLDSIPSTVPPARFRRLSRFWTDSMLRMAGGQQRDLDTVADNLSTLSIDDYQQMAQAKTGATFALAFGGTAMLVSDEQPVIDALILVGEIYGTLVQYSDDIADAEHQPNETATLPRVLRALPLADNVNAPRAFWNELYPQYRSAAMNAVAALTPTLQDAVASLFTQAFEASSSEAGV